jgi:hypothetical protein
MSSRNRVLETALVQYAAADTSKTLVAAPSGGVNLLDTAKLRIHRITYLSETASANEVTVACGATEFCIIDNLAANGVFDTGHQEGGVLCPDETALIASSTAGAKGKFIVTYSID